MVKTFVVAFILLWTGCKEISYKEPQPKGKRALSEIPRELRGKYLVVEENGNNQDTLIVTNNGYHFTNDSTKGELSDSLVLKKYQGYYFFNDNENPEWLLRVIKKESNGDLTFMYMETGEKSFHEFLYALNEEIKIDSFEINNEMLYQIDPTPKQLIDLIKKDYFKKSITLQKVK
jgi:hypothetical protein